ncbi:P-loop NTPase fold protein [Larkinella insperata]|uniref:P-loop NTPase fold protein n=1 Tax=Larkinella insperata TaxID=332158 RepID=A0ABW3QCJ8_9BACT
MWADNETTEDLLGFRVHAELIKEVIIKDDILPVTIGVFGDWGSGKSSVLSVLKDSFNDETDGKTICLYFNSWTFEGYDDAKAALIESILEELENNKKFIAKVTGKAGELKNRVKDLIGSVKWMRLLGMGFKNVALPAAAAYFSGGITLIPYLAQTLGKLTSDPDKLIENLQGEKAEEFLKEIIEEQKESSGTKEKNLMIREFRKDFSELIKATDIERLVVIIDDLDRCSSDRLIENLEAIKLFLNVEKTAFIIGADPRIVRHAIRRKYGYKGDESDSNEEGEKNERIVDDYLEKLIQVPYYLPKLSDSEAQTYLSLLLCKRYLKDDEYDNVIQGYNSLIDKNRYATYDYAAIKAVYPKVDENLILSKELSSLPALASIISETLYGNPRQIKRFLNSFMLRKRLSEVANIQGFEGNILAKLMVLEYAEEDLFRSLYNWQIAKEGFPTELKEMEDLCNGKSVIEAQNLIKEKYANWSKKDKVVRWLLKEPLLSTIDLRDYFWLSRDRISSIIPSNVLIPPLAKQVFSLIYGSPSEGEQNRLIDSDIKSFDSMNLDGFYKLLLKKITTESSKREGLVVLILMVEKQIIDSETMLLTALNSIPKNKIPPAIFVRVENLRRVEFATFIADYKAEMEKANRKK